MFEKAKVTICVLIAIVTVVFFGFLSVISFMLCSITQGFVLMKLWSWFVVPVFGISQLSLIAAIGLIMVATFLTTKRFNDNVDRKINKMFDKKKKKPSNEFEKSAKYREVEKKNFRNGAIRLLFQVIIGPAFILLFGWLIHFFM